jgi:hypothetical protein
MKIHIDDRQILAIEVRRSCIGYATFLGPKQLLDYGATTPYPLQGAAKRAERRIVSMLRMLPPAVVVLKKPRKGLRQRKLVQFITHQASCLSIPVVLIASNEVRQPFSIFHARNKDEVADVLARIFPDLMFRLPPKRHTGDSERHAMLVFDAIATGFAYMQRTGMQTPPPE